MKRMAQRASSRARRMGSRLVLALAAPLLAQAPAMAAPCARSPEACSTLPTYQVRYNVVSPVPLANIVVHSLFPSDILQGQGDFAANGQAALPTGTGVLDAGRWFGENLQFLMGVGGGHLFVAMRPDVATLVQGKPLEFMVNGSPVDPVYEIPVGQAEAIILDSLVNRPVEWQADVSQFFRPRPNYPNRLLPHLAVNAFGTFDVATMNPADFVLMQYSNGAVVGSVRVEVSPVPAPASAAMLLAGLVVLALRRRKLPQAA